MGDIAGLVGLARVLPARNGAKGAMVARICADVKNRNGCWRASVLCGKG